MSVLKLIASENFITVNKYLIKLLGLEEAILLGELASEFDYWEQQGKLENGWFYSTVENVEENTGLTKHKQREALANLKKAGIIKFEKRGIPAKRYIKIVDDKLSKISTTSCPKIEPLVVQKSDDKLSKISTTSCPKIEPLVVQKSDINKNKLIRITNKNKQKESKKESKKESPRHFLGEGYLNLEKDSSKAKAFEETKSRLQDFSLSQESVVCNKSKAGSQKNNSEMKALDLSKNDLACQKTKASRVKTIENRKLFDEIIEAYTQNEKLRFELKEHLKIRKQKKAALTNRAIELSLQKLNSLASSDEEKLQIVQNAVMGGWTTFYPLRREEREPRHMRSESKSGNIFADMCETLKAEKEKENNYFEISVNSHD